MRTFASATRPPPRTRFWAQKLFPVALRREYRTETRPIARTAPKTSPFWAMWTFGDRPSEPCSGRRNWFRSRFDANIALNRDQLRAACAKRAVPAGSGRLQARAGRARPSRLHAWPGRSDSWPGQAERLRGTASAEAELAGGTSRHYRPPGLHPRCGNSLSRGAMTAARVGGPEGRPGVGLTLVGPVRKRPLRQGRDRQGRVGPRVGRHGRAVHDVQARVRSRPGATGR